MKQLFNSLSGLFFTLCLLTAATQVQAATWYVATNGSDGNAGTTPAAPFQTIQKGADVARAGDTVKVSAGVYAPQTGYPPYRGMIYFRNSGEPNNPITFEAVGSVTVKGDGGVWTFGGIFEITKDQAGARPHDIVIRGFRFENSAWFGIHVAEADRILLENNYTYNTGGSGIEAQKSTNITVRNNTIERAAISPDPTMDSQECISLSDVNGFEISDNHVFNGGGAPGEANGGEGIDAKGASSNGTIHHNRVHDLVRLGIYVDAWDQVQENVRVYNNVVYRTFHGIAVSSENGGTVRGVKIYNNIVSSTDENGIVVSSWSRNGRRENIEIVNNTVFYNGFHRNGQDFWGGGINIETANAANILIRNNLVSQNNKWQILVNRSVLNVTVDHNLIDGFRSFVTDAHDEVKGASFVEANPLLVDSVGGDFHLLPNSPAIDSGNSLLAPADDNEGIARPQGAGVDIGGYEYVGTQSPISGVYKITALHSGKALDVSGVSLADRAVVQQWSYGGGANQRWRVEANGDGTYKMTAQHSGKVLTAANSGTANGTKIWQTGWNDSCAQKWLIEARSDGAKTVRSSCSDKVLDVSGASPANGATLQLWTSSGLASRNQAFVFERIN
jgi:parallel beta-helix repeat protein